MATVNPTGGVAKNNINNLMQLLSFTAEKVEGLSKANTVLGDPVTVEGVTLIPVSKISAGFAGGSADMSNMAQKKRTVPAGTGAKTDVTPVAFLAVKDGQVTLLKVDEKADGSDFLSSAVAQVKNLFAKK